MVNYQTLLGTGIARTFINGNAVLVVSAGPGKLYGLSALSTNTSPVYLQVFDAPTQALAESSGTWTGAGPIDQVQVVKSSSDTGLCPEIMFEPPISLQTGLVLLLSTSATGYTADASAATISCSFVPDPVSTLGATVPA
jgi:hypothetical protein